MKTFVASTALALVISVPAIAQTTVTTTQEGAQGFYQPSGQELFASEIIGQDVFAPQTAGQQDAAMQPAGTAAPDSATTGTTTTEATQAGAAGDQQVVTTDQQVTEGEQAVTADAQPAMTGGRMMTQDELGQMENVGQVTEIIFSPEGEISAVVVEVGGFLGMGARDVALDMGQLDFVHDADNPEQVYVVTQVGADQLEAAPDYDRQQIGVAMQQDPATQEQAQVVPADQDPAAQPQAPVVATGPDAAWRGDRQAMGAQAMQREGYAQAEAQEFTADNLLGANVYDINDNNIGNVDDVVLGQAGEAQFAVVDVGGFLGFGTHTIALGFDEMTVLHDDGWSDLRIYVDVTQDQLERMPEYQEGQQAN
ncbi:hypothetical protein BH23PSE1_BH23PSE1_06330 [soil metagenome]